MKQSKLILSAAGILILGLLLGRYVLPRDVQSQEETPPPSEEPVASIWTCSMHPQIKQPDPGDCPICGMDLIPLIEDSREYSGPREMRMSESAKALADIQTRPVTRDYPEAKVRMVGKLEVDETRVKSLTARFPARIDRLFVNYTGIPVNKGEHLAEVYSPELLSAQREFLSSYQNNPDSSITAAAREKLRLWDLLPEQISSIIDQGNASDSFTLKAPIGGIVLSKNVKEGDYIQTGEPLFKIVDLSVLWLYLDAYESDLPWLKHGQSVEFTVASFPGKTFTGQIAFIHPEVDPKTRTVPIRINVPNPENQLKPGMFANGIVRARLAEDGQIFAPEFAGKWISPMHPEIIKDAPGQCDVCGMDLVSAESLGYVNSKETNPPLVLPASAVLKTGKRAIVYVENPDTDRPSYEGREIVLGPRAGDVYLVTSGLQEHERVVTHGAFKIDSALQIQAKPSMMNEKKVSKQGRMETGVLKLNPEEAIEILPGYLSLQAALTQDDLDSAKTALGELMSVTGHEGPLAMLIHKMRDAENLDGIRRPHFETLSNALIATVKENPSALNPEHAPLFQMQCPMVYSDRENNAAEWLQADENLRNPYFGASMLHCGETKKVLGK